ncbi:MAG: sialidase family protein, partial [Propionibacterium sp.]|nr:sialidase family protein [Propionibacterium sp.]
AAAGASPVAGSVLVAGTTAQGAAITGSFDGGQTWQTVLQTGQPGGQAGVFTYLGFTTSTQGVALTASGAGTGNGQNVGTLYVTRDGGRTWSAVSFAGQ